MTNNEKIRITELTLKSLDSVITAQEFAELNNYIASSQEIADYYSSCIAAYTIISDQIEQLQGESEEFDLLESAATGSKVGDSSNVSLRGVGLQEFMANDGQADVDDSEEANDLLEVLELVRNSPALEREKPVPEEPERELIQKVESNFKWFPGKPSKRKTRTLLAMVASIMAVFGYLYFFAPENIDRPVVAKLDDSIRAEWDNELATPDEFGDMVQSRYRLKKGFITILLNDGAKVTVEAPAELSLDSPSAMELFSGRIYSIVPKRAKGFAVRAASSKIVDLGTEFGVEVDSSGNTQLHVTKGKTLLFAGLVDGEKEEVKVDAGEAKKVYNDGFVKDIDLDERRFVRHFDSKTGFVWSGQLTVDLADLVRGGNGFGTGKPGICLGLIDGKFTNSRKYGPTFDSFPKPSKYFFEVHKSPYVDSVFIPDGGDGNVRVSSAGHVFNECPDTKGLDHSIFYSIFAEDTLKVYDKSWPVKLDNKIYGTKDHPAITISSNGGITFDLGALRSLTGVVDIKKTFTVKCGMIQRDFVERANADVRVLVDGREKFKAAGIRVSSDPSVINLELSNNDRFLTLLVTEGEDKSTSGDWIVFAEPVLYLTER